MSARRGLGFTGPPAWDQQTYEGHVCKSCGCFVPRHLVEVYMLAVGRVVFPTQTMTPEAPPTRLPPRALGALTVNRVFANAEGTLGCGGVLRCAQGECRRCETGGGVPVPCGDHVARADFSGGSRGGFPCCAGGWRAFQKVWSARRVCCFREGTVP